MWDFLLVCFVVIGIFFLNVIILLYIRYLCQSTEIYYTRDFVLFFELSHARVNMVALVYVRFSIFTLVHVHFYIL